MEKYYGIKPFGQTPTPIQLEHLRLGKKAFFHFGVNTFSGKEWGDGTEREKMFAPSDCNVRGWIRDIKSAGFELAIITAKHHDGFCLWPSKYTEHSVKNSPYKDGKGDIIREFVDACHEYNVRVGLYISPWDRNSEFWGKDEYSLYYARQLEELVTEYGRIDEIWWDGAGSGETRYDFGLWAYIIKKHQPNAVIFGSMGATPYVDMRWVGNEAGYAGKTHYASINAEHLEVENVSMLNTGELLGNRYIPAEVDVSIRPGWFYHDDQDGLVKTPLELDELWFRSVGNNAIELLNFPPDRTGNLPDVDIKHAVVSNRRIKRMLAVNLLEGADVRADSVYCEETEIAKAVISDDSLFYASMGDRAVIDILLPDDAPEFNVLMLAEKVELGERITEFLLECLDADEPQILCKGTSVGYLKAVRFALKKRRALRLTLIGAIAPLTLRTLSLNVYDSEGEADLTSIEKQNLAELKSCEVIMSEDGRSAQVMFGGIYPFDTVSFMTAWRGGYKISAFDGSKYYTIAEGEAEKYKVTVKLDEPIVTSYQIKIECERGIASEPDITVL